MIKVVKMLKETVGKDVEVGWGNQGVFVEKELS